jgi:membrane fusion protein, multidrug efflux system
VNELSNRPLAGSKNGQTKPTGSFKRRGSMTIVTWIVVMIAIAVLGVGLVYYQSGVGSAGRGPAQAPPQVVVSRPLKKELDTQLGFLGQFSAVDQVELRAQVGGTLTEIHFKDGDIVHK